MERALRTSGRARAALRLAAAAAALVCFAACTTVSGTKRTQFNVLSKDQERDLGKQAYAQALGEAGVKTLASGPDYDRVQRVAKRIEESAQRLHPDAVKGFEWQWTVIDDDKTVNAWALPGGRSAVYTGMLRMAKTDDELAIVMGHEASHAIARHSGERISSDMAIQAALSGASIAMSDMSPATQQATMAALGVGTQYGMALPWSRKQESEADELGLFIAADAGYDPRSGPILWQRMAESHAGEAPPEFMSTHPSDTTRIERLQKLMRKAMVLYVAAVQRDGGPAPGSTPTGPAEVPPAPAKKKKAS
ncbi:MAG: M48 family metallopeptidase [Phycisphaerales bacterium]